MDKNNLRVLINIQEKNCLQFRLSAHAAFFQQYVLTPSINSKKNVIDLRETRITSTLRVRSAKTQIQYKYDQITDGKAIHISKSYFHCLVISRLKIIKSSNNLIELQKQAERYLTAPFPPISNQNASSNEQKPRRKYLSRNTILA